MQRKKCGNDVGRPGKLIRPLGRHQMRGGQIPTTIRLRGVEARKRAPVCGNQQSAPVNAPSSQAVEASRPNT